MRCIDTGVAGRRFPAAGPSGRPNAGVTEKPCTLLVVHDVAEALAAVADLRPDGVFFRTAPGDIERLGELPRGLQVHVPYHEDLTQSCRGGCCRIKVRVTCSQRSAAERTAARQTILLRLSRAGFESTIHDMDRLTPGEAISVVRLFLHDPGITDRVDPFMDILGALVRREAVSLWAILGPDPSARVFVTPDGRIGATPDAVGPGCAVSEFAAQWRTSEAGQAVDHFLFSLPQHNSDCLACPFFCVCEGYGAWRGSCQTWRAVLAVLSRAAGRLRVNGAAAVYTREFPRRRRPPRSGREDFRGRAFLPTR